MAVVLEASGHIWELEYRTWCGAELRKGVEEGAHVCSPRYQRAEGLSRRRGGSGLWWVKISGLLTSHMSKKSALSCAPDKTHVQGLRGSTLHS